MAHSSENRIEQLLSGKSDSAQNRLRRAFMAAGLDDRDAAWILIDIIDIYGDEMKKNSDVSVENLKEIQAIRNSIQNDLKKNITSHFKMIREVSYSEYKGLVDNHIKELENHIDEKTKESEERITRKYNAIGNSLIKAIDGRYNNLDAKIDERINELVKRSVESRMHPVARMISGIMGIGFLIIALGIFGGLALVAGAHLQAGNADLIQNIFSW